MWCPYEPKWLRDSLYSKTLSLHISFRPEAAVSIVFPTFFSTFVRIFIPYPINYPYKSVFKMMDFCKESQVLEQHFNLSYLSISWKRIGHRPGNQDCISNSNFNQGLYFRFRIYNLGNVCLHHISNSSRNYQLIRQVL